MLALKILAGIAAVLLLLLVCPLRLEVGFREEFSLTVRYLFLRFQVMPPKEETERQRQKREKKEAKKQAKAAAQGEKPSTVDQLKEILHRTGVKGFLQAIRQLAVLAGRSLKRVFRHLRWKAFDLYLCVGGAQDAAQAAITYGECSAAVYSAVGALFSLSPCRHYGVTVDLNYQAQEMAVDFSARLSILPLFLAREAFSLLIHGFPVVWRLIRPAKDQAAGPKKSIKQPEPRAKGELT